MPLDNPIDDSSTLATILRYTAAIDHEAIDGLAGATDSLSYDVNEIEVHLHSVGRWYGKDQDTFMIENGLNAWQLTAGNAGAYGNWLQLDDGAGVVYGAYYDPHQILVTQASVAGGLYYIQFGKGESGAQVLTGMTAAIIPANLRQAPHLVQSERVASTAKYWARCCCTTNAGTISFVIGIHCYSG